MTNTTWEKTPEVAQQAQSYVANRKRYVYLIIGLVLIGAVAYLVISGMATGSYYMTVDELLADSNNIGKDVRVAGAVDGDTIKFDPETQILTFTVAAIPNDNETIREQGGLGQVLYNALQDPDNIRMPIQWQNAEMPDLLQNEAQAIMEGHIDENGVFHANNVLLKCPTRYSDDVPQQAADTQ